LSARRAASATTRPRWRRSTCTSQGRNTGEPHAAPPDSHTAAMTLHPLPFSVGRYQVSPIAGRGHPRRDDHRAAVVPRGRGRPTRTATRSPPTRAPITSWCAAAPDADGAAGPAHAPESPSLARRVWRWAQPSGPPRQVVPAPAARYAPLAGFAGLWYLVDEAHVSTNRHAPGFSRARGGGAAAGRDA
jgi:hypothetical protein